MSILSGAMTEKIKYYDKEVESQTHGQITVIFIKHVNQKGFDNGEPMWPPEVYEIVAKLKPFVIAVDSLQPGFTSKHINQMIPVRDPSPLEPGAHVVAADGIELWSKSDNPMVGQDHWEQIIKAVIKFDSDFGPHTQRASVTEMLRQQFAREEGVVSAGLAALTARIIWRAHESHKKNPQPRQFTRRGFLKLAGGLAAGAVVTAINYGREPIFFDNLRKTQVTDGTPTIDQTLVLATRPVLYTDPWVKIRNARLGVAVMSKFNHPDWSKKSAVIIFGNAHQIDEYPGQKSSETLEQAIDRLLDVMRHGFEEIERNNQAGKNVVPPDVMAAALTEIFATRDTYLPMKLNLNPQAPELTWINVNSDLVPEVVNLITEIYP